MSPGSSTESYPAFARIGLRENPGINLNQVTCPDRESNPGHLVSQPDALTVAPQLNCPHTIRLQDLPSVIDLETGDLEFDLPRPSILTEVFHGLPQPHQASVGNVPNMSHDIKIVCLCTSEGRVSIPGPLVERTSALPLSYPGTPPDTVSTFPFISTQLAWTDEPPETHSPRELCGYKGKVETVSGGVPG
ncbi:hypothetical protein ANN_24188 [Periplaneta americana]|uniref:Uncharacterized protein n=1 Tax=Periplaneta americana TaxID=6978 RepID=A0ABQ8S2E1_PERAM|nr:hypothetical protein ANN_24188 [Periplaneta americana]